LAAEAGEREKLTVFDTTLRDGEQSPGATLSLGEKITIARHLSLMGVDVCEAGFPIASPGDFKSVSAIAKEIGPLTESRTNGPMTICGLSRANEKDISCCYEAVQHAPSNRIHTFLATSDIHLKYKLKISRDECIRTSTEAVRFAKSLGAQQVEFSPEDAGRSDPEFLTLVLEEVIKSGATTINVPDTVGYTLPDEYGECLATSVPWITRGVLVSRLPFI
jgi:2-isopropylmalate synthase